MFRAVIKTTRERQPQPGTVNLTMEENGITKSMGSFNLQQAVTAENPLRLKLTKKGSLYTAYYALSDGEFVRLGSADMLLKDLKAGVMACDGIVAQFMKSTFWFNSDTTKPNTPFDVSFDYLRITNYGIQ